MLSSPNRILEWVKNSETSLVAPEQPVNMFCALPVQHFSSLQSFPCENVLSITIPTVLLTSKYIVSCFIALHKAGGCTAGGGWMGLTQLTLGCVMAEDGLHFLHSLESKEEPGGRCEQQWGLFSIRCVTLWSWSRWREAWSVMPSLTGLANCAR